MRQIRGSVFCLVLTGCVSTPMKGTVRVALPIVQTGDPVLRNNSEDVPVERIQTPEFQALLEKMISAMRAAPGVGLAAPQIGVPLRVFVLEDSEERMAALTAQERQERGRVPVPLRVFINPQIKPLSKNTVTFFEGCLSVSGFAALVPRYEEVEVTALDEHANPVQWRVSGWPARIVQHENDHLNGVLYIDRMDSRSFGTAAHIKERFAGKPISEILREQGLRVTGE